MIARRAPAPPGSDGDADDIRAAAEAAGLSEFDLFRAAYRHWYNDKPDMKVLEARFATYLFEGTVPPFVRHYARLVQAGRAGDGPETRGLRHREPPVPPDALFIAVLLLLALAVYLLLGSG